MAIDYTPFRGPAPRGSQPHPGERLLEFDRGLKRYRCGLRDHGVYGVEAQFLERGTLLIARTFRERIDSTRTPRELAIAWANEERQVIEKGSE
jgi:hypothetical protein